MIVLIFVRINAYLNNGCVIFFHNVPYSYVKWPQYLWKRQYFWESITYYTIFGIYFSHADSRCYFYPTNYHMITWAFDKFIWCFKRIAITPIQRSRSINWLPYSSYSFKNSSANSTCCHLLCSVKVVKVRVQG